MAVYKIFPTKDTTLYSTYPIMNTGLDAILEVHNKLGIDGSPQVARYLVEFDQNEINDIITNKISSSQYNIYLKNFIAEAQGLNQNTSLEILPIAQSWNNGTGYFLDNPKEENGSSWVYSNYSGSNPWSMSGSINGFGFTGSYNILYSPQGGGNFFTGSNFKITQSFQLRDGKDIEIDVTTTTNSWFNSLIPNNGFLIKLTGSQEFNSSEYIQPQFKYYSVDTNTIYPPCLEFRWRDYSSLFPTPSPIVTTSDLKMSLAENPGVFYPTSINRFYINVSPLYPDRIYQTSSLFTNLNYLPTSSYYAIKDLDTNEFIINFDDDYTQISSDVNGNYFDVYMSGLEPERYYSVLIKTNINGSTKIFNDDYYFKVING